jgi:RNA polymerase sigma-70 factor (ECF subfamily)
MNDELALIKRAQEGDSEAFLDLISRYDRPIMSVVYRLTYDRYDREDLYQEVFLGCFRSIKSFKFRSSLVTWLYRVALNRSISYLKKSRRKVDYQEAPAPGPDMDRQAKLEAIQRALSRLHGHEKLCFHLHYIEEWNIERIAETLDCAEGTVKSYLHRARSRIKMDPEVLVWQTNP